MPFGVNTAPERFECKVQEKVADLSGVEVLQEDMLEQLSRKLREITIRISRSCLTEQERSI